jgi:hypothetical protein
MNEDRIVVRDENEAVPEKNESRLKVNPNPAPQGPQRHYTRRERRDIERRMGLLNMSGKTKQAISEVKERRAAYGKAVHRKFVQDTHNRLAEQDAEREAKQYADLVEMHGKEKADKMVEKWAKREAKKRAKK